MNKFWRGTVILPLAAVVLSPIAWVLWVITASRYQQGKHDFILLVVGFMSLTVTLWAVLLTGAACIRLLIMYQRRRQARHRRHVLGGQIRLVYIGCDKEGFGSARDPITHNQYLLNEETDGYPWQQLAPGASFRAEVTRAQYVARVSWVYP
ncbi:MAG: hypothetical protein E6P95_02830 [Candidatus Moraniibacteriota bacterium]|nr:MAG: hypothetical protein E6P95_02830 [Candidatus Moranbacteria bacterium]